MFAEPVGFKDWIPASARGRGEPSAGSPRCFVAATCGGVRYLVVRLPVGVRGVSVCSRCGCAQASARSLRSLCSVMSSRSPAASSEGHNRTRLTARCSRPVSQPFGQQRRSAAQIQPNRA